MESQLNYPPLNDQMYINEPDRLEDICVKVLVENKERCLFQIQITEESKLEIRCGIYLPALVADQLFNKLLKLSDCYCVSGPCPETNVFRGFDSTTLNIVELLQSFSNTQKCCLNNVQFNAQTQLNSEVLGRLCSTQNIQNIQISNSTVTPEPSLLQHLLHEKTHSLTLDNISYCESSIIEPTCISRESHPKLRHLKFRDGEIPAYSCFVNADSPPHLVAVELSNFYEKGASHNVDLKRRVSKIRDLLEVNKAGSGDAVQGKQLTATVQGVLRRYVETVDKLEAPQTVNEEKLLLHSCSLLLMQYRLESMRETLCSLVLCNTLFTGSDLSTIFQLKKLRHLDISMLPPMRGENKRRPETTVYKVMEELPALVSLDVGGTKIGDHLYRDGRVKETTGDRYLKETPPRKLEFLGLYNCEGCELMDIYSLADTIVGYTGEVQLLASLTYYMNRATPLMYIVGQARQLQTVHNLSCPQRLTTLLLKVLQSHRRNRRIIEEVTANLFYLSSTYYTTCSKQQKNDIITELIISIETCQDMKYVVRNSLVSLFHFDIPGDVIFAFVKISKVILNTLLKYHEDDDIGRHAIHFCNALGAFTNYICIGGTLYVYRFNKFKIGVKALCVSGVL